MKKLLKLIFPSYKKGTLNTKLLKWIRSYEVLIDTEGSGIVVPKSNKYKSEPLIRFKEFRFSKSKSVSILYLSSNGLSYRLFFDSVHDFHSWVFYRMYLLKYSALMGNYKPYEGVAGLRDAVNEFHNSGKYKIRAFNRKYKKI